MTIACVVIAGGTRAHLLDGRILPDLLRLGVFEEIVVVGEHHDGEGYRYLPVPALTRTTVDALIKRDVGTLATTADLLCYLSDDHTIREFDRSALGGHEDLNAWGCLVPSRVSVHPKRGLVLIPNGADDGYCAGHAGLFTRAMIQAMPWTTMPHDRLWDVWASQRQQAAGYRFISSSAVVIEDLEPQARPWE